MGMYTGLRAKVIIKPEFRDAIAVLHGPEHDWDAVYRQFPGFPGNLTWHIVSRRQFIPYGCLAYMPDDFSDAEDGESFSKFDPATGVWEFCCSLKNYESEIECFIENVLKHIVARVAYCESLYEELYAEDDWRQQVRKHLRRSDECQEDQTRQGLPDLGTRRGIAGG